jgi:dsDNA-specific endonuclease/ATPase MutS2
MRLSGGMRSTTCAVQSHARLPLLLPSTRVYSGINLHYRQYPKYFASSVLYNNNYTISSGGGDRSGGRLSAISSTNTPATTNSKQTKFIGTSEHLQPASLSTLHVLEWERLCHHVAAFASTSLGQRMCATLFPETTPAACESLLAETRAVDALEAEFAADVDFGGIQTLQALEAITRASRGGMLTGRGLVSIATLVTGATKLQKAIQYTAKDAEFTGLGDTSVLSPVLEVFKNVRNHPQLSSEIGFAIKDDGSVREAASDEVKKAAGKVRTLEGRIRGILKGLGGEITEHGGRMCCAVAASASDGPPRGILLGSGPGGAVWYVESAAAVPINNELASAKVELAAAEEAVLWRLTGKVADFEADLEHALHAVVWLDSVAARARYGRWIGGTLPKLIPFPKTGKARGSSAARKKKQQQQQAKVENNIKMSSSSSSGGVVVVGEEGEEEVEEEVESSKYIVYLRKLRHPLLLGEYLLAKQNGGGSGSGSGSDSGQGTVGGGEKREQRLPGWRRTNPDSYSTSSDSEDEDQKRETAAVGAPAPIPVDIFISASTRAVIITGPNTGGKTASMKALGLASLAARAGLPIPAAGPALLPCFDSVLADIGDEQSLTASLSTFSGHLRRIEALRSESSGKSLVLLDELGTGTDPTEGAALGIALLKVLAKGGGGGAALTMATTHHSELTALKYEENNNNSNSGGDTNNLNNNKGSSTNSGGALFEGAEKKQPSTLSSSSTTSTTSDPKFENASVEFDEVKLAPTYKILWGVPGRSNALNIAERLGLDIQVVEAARERLGVAAAAVNDSIVVLEEARKTQDRDEAAAMEMEERARAARTKAATLKREIIRRRAEKELEQASTIRASLHSSRAQLVQIKRDLAAKAAQDLAAAEYAALSAKDRSALEKQKAGGWVPSLGQFVFVPRLNSRAKVVAVDSGGGGSGSGEVSLTLQAGLMKITANVDEVRERQ